MGRYRAGRAHMAPFLHNQWYTAATSVELGEISGILGRPLKYDLDSMV